MARGHFWSPVERPTTQLCTCVTCGATLELHTATDDRVPVGDVFTCAECGTTLRLLSHGITEAVVLS